MAGNQDIEIEIREPTGLGLGTFDLFVVCQKIYEGELAPTCQFRTTQGDWVALTERAEFADIFWLLDESTEDPNVQKRATFGGWKTDAAEDSKVPGTAQNPPSDASEPQRRGLRGLTGRFRTRGLPKDRPKGTDK